MPSPTTYPNPPAVRSALRFFKVMAFLAGLALVILALAMYWHYGLDSPRFSELWSPIHGLIYFVYFISIFNLGNRCKWSLVRIGLLALTGFVPLLPWIAERRVAREVEAGLAASEASATAATGR
ncbi:DUF3817 domain-containing protein [Arsenicicoccus piscis]|uniref:DUF3817 domain-containing protein n=1 Tax=Arsenicicoccus piscis TaxID=673954 RepID=A0ABQ6HR57_9MICO|nr:DUF3817 domain-containing protein [Arsenicicoccus piscis]MCH8628129.1 DUF3817 domain-containing protein [Arsenicicoccus piscis]GMA20492.1 hypothetical protein GCM10025862_25130 [Arsenicicoccus piscis]